MRGFKIARGYEELVVELPQRGTKYSAGYDLAAIKDYIVKPCQIVLVETGLKAYFPIDEVLKIYPRSSLPKRGLTMPNCVGIIDSDYFENDSNDGHIFLQVYNFTKNEVVITKGDRLCQGIFEKYYISENDNASGKRVSGFGSTDNKN